MCVCVWAFGLQTRSCVCVLRTVLRSRFVRVLLSIGQLCRRRPSIPVSLARAARPRRPPPLGWAGSVAVWPRASSCWRRPRTAASAWPRTTSWRVRRGPRRPHMRPRGLGRVMRLCHAGRVGVWPAARHPARVSAPCLVSPRCEQTAQASGRSGRRRWSSSPGSCGRARWRCRRRGGARPWRCAAPWRCASATWLWAEAASTCALVSLAWEPGVWGCWPSIVCGHLTSGRYSDTDGSARWARAVD
jgi:hypothetical protein